MKNITINRVQKTLFQEKQTIIENCLFGVDINPNSVKICRLRLWVELLKNAYYKFPSTEAMSAGQSIEKFPSNGGVSEGRGGELETLPNIDINIKCGNSLLSRFALDADLSKALKSIKYNISAYRGFVHEYKNAKNRDVKRELQKLINGIKSDFRTEINKNDPKQLKLNKLRGEVLTLQTQENIFELTTKEKKEKADKLNKLLAEITKLEREIEDIQSNAIYKNAFEWRFEFPEVINNKGEFEGFDLIIGNPPYGAEIPNREALKTLFPKTSVGQIDTYKYFIELCLRISKKNGISTYITSDSYLEKKYFQDVRTILNNNSSSLRNIKLGDNIFEGINLPTAIFQIQKGSSATQYEYKDISNVAGNMNKENLLYNDLEFITTIPQFETSFSIKTSILNDTNCEKLIDVYDQVMGVKVYQIGKGKPKQTSYEIDKNLFIKDKKIDENHYKFVSQGIGRYSYKSKGEWINYGEWLAEPRQLRYFNQPKIVIREIVNPRIYATYIEEKAVVKNIAAVIVEKDPNYSLKYLLALLNSKLFTYYLFEQTPKGSNKSYPSFTSEIIKNIPIKKISLNEQKIFADLVDKILTEIQKGENTADNEKLIDTMVYELYHITEEEQKLIEG